MNRILKRAFQKANQAKTSVVAGSSVVIVTASQAAITFDDTTKSFTGDIDTTAYTSGVGIYVTFLALAMAVGFGISALRGRRGA